MTTTKISQISIISAFILAFTLSFHLTTCWQAHDDIWRAIKRRGYEAEVPPLRQDASPIVVSISLTLMDVIDLDEVNEIMVSAWLPLVTWTDERLSWNPANNSDTTELQLPAKVIWTPDITIFNSLDDPSRSLFNTNFRISLSYDGLVKWNTPGVVKSTCGIDVRHFPFDYQICYIRIESSSTLVKDQLLSSLGNITREELINNVTDTELWSIEDLWFTDCINKCASSIKYLITLRRKPVYYVLNVILPILVLSLIALLVFWLPAGSGEKVGLAVTVVLSFTVAQDTMGNIVPKTSDSLPLLSIYLVASSVMSAMSLVAAVLVLRLKEYASVRPPRWLYRASCCLGRVTCITPPHHSQVNDDLQSPPDIPLNNVQQQPEQHSATSDDKVNGSNSQYSSTVSLAYGQKVMVQELKALRRRMKCGIDVTLKNWEKAENADHVTNEWELIARVFDRLLFIIFAAINVALLALFLFNIMVGSDMEEQRQTLEMEHCDNLVDLCN